MKVDNRAAAASKDASASNSEGKVRMGSDVYQTLRGLQRFLRQETERAWPVRGRVNSDHHRGPGGAVAFRLMLYSWQIPQGYLVGLDVKDVELCSDLID
jgi:hypothetical protein